MIVEVQVSSNRQRGDFVIERGYVGSWPVGRPDQLKGGPVLGTDRKRLARRVNDAIAPKLASVPRFLHWPLLAEGAIFSGNTRGVMGSK